MKTMTIVRQGESTHDCDIEIQLDGKVIAAVKDMATARLFVSTPKLLEALRTCLEFVDSGGLGGGVNAQAKASLEQYLSKAIAKTIGSVK